MLHRDNPVFVRIPGYLAACYGCEGEGAWVRAAVCARKRSSVRAVAIVLVRVNSVTYSLSE